MRTIEREIIRTFIDFVKDNGTSRQEKNLSCRDVVETNQHEVIYKLWGSKIFRFDDKEGFFFSFCGYGTNTTKGRLNALMGHFGCGGFFQKDYRI